MKEISIILLSSFKFAMAFPLAVIRFEFGFFQTIFWTNTGGILGILFFSYVSDKIIKLWTKYFKRGKSVDRKDRISTKKRKIFTSRRRKIVQVKSRYGLVGIAFLTPILFSIPLGAFLAARYFKPAKTRLLYLTLSNLIWSIIYTSFYIFFYDIYLDWIA